MTGLGLFQVVLLHATLSLAFLCQGAVRSKVYHFADRESGPTEPEIIEGHPRSTGHVRCHQEHRPDVVCFSLLFFKSAVYLLPLSLCPLGSLWFSSRPCSSIDFRDGIDWVIVGGESGPGARPMEADWIRDIRDRCLGSNVPFFFKQWGGVFKKRNGRTIDDRTWDQMPEILGKVPSR